jgi:hypothetical protein
MIIAAALYLAALILLAVAVGMKGPHQRTARIVAVPLIFAGVAMTFAYLATS